MITKKYYKLIRVSYEDQQYLTLTNTSGTAGGFNLVKEGTQAPTPNLEYSLNGVDWTSYDFTNLPTVTIPIDGHIYLRGNNSNGFNRTWNCYKLNMDVDFEASGNLFSLRNTDPTIFSTYTSVQSYEFYYLFNGTNLTDASRLLTNVITTVSESGLTGLFQKCGKLRFGSDFSNINSVVNYSMGGVYDSCYKLEKIIAPNVSTWNTTAFNSWAQYAGSSVTGTKTFYAPTGLEIPTNSSGIPNGWTRVDY